MKRLALVFIASIGPLVLGACQEKLELKIDIVAGNIEGTEDEETVTPPCFEEIMPLNGSNSQGGDCWGDYFFQFTANNTVVRVYDLTLKTLVQTISITSSLRGFVPNCHCNTVCFGTEYYDAEDIFPLIYVSTGYSSGGYTGVLVYRITQHNGLFFITLVQTIKFPADESSWTEFIPAGEYAYVFYSSDVLKFKMPRLKDGDIVVGRDSAIVLFHFPPVPNWLSTSKQQDRLFYHGTILYISGVPQIGEASALVILNLETQTQERIIDLKKFGLKTESESLFVWRGDLCVAFVDKIVRLIDFIDTP